MSYFSYFVPLSTPPDTDAATVYLDLQVSTAEVFDGVDSAEVYLELSVTSVEEYTRFDAATVYLDLQPLGGECYSTYSGRLLGEGEAELRWRSGGEELRWSDDEELRWSYGDVQVEGINC